jgi:hypothetical protein
MTQYEMIVGYLTALTGRFRDDDRGQVLPEWIVLVGVALVATAVVAGILWAKLKGGAEDVKVERPAAP